VPVFNETLQEHGTFRGRDYAWVGIPEVNFADAGGRADPASNAAISATALGCYAPVIVGGVPHRLFPKPFSQVGVLVNHFSDRVVTDPEDIQRFDRILKYAIAERFIAHRQRCNPSGR
jgi:hypothetical protein